MIRRAQLRRLARASGVRGLELESYGWGLVRLRLGIVEITIDPREIADLLRWAREHAHDAADARLPVGEFVAPGWDRSYRWSALADRVYRASRAKGRR